MAGGISRLVVRTQGQVPQRGQWHGRVVPSWQAGGALRWMLVRDPEGDLNLKAFLCTDRAANPIDILQWFVRRWYAKKVFAHGGHL